MYSNKIIELRILNKELAVFRNQLTLQSQIQNTLNISIASGQPPPIK